MSATIALIGIVSSSLLFIFLFFKTRHRERMALIENDKNADIFRSEFGHVNNLKYGIVAVAVGLGLFGANVMDEVVHLHLEASYIALPLILGGVALIVYYKMFADRNQDQI